jgi:hypothetical protein
LIFSFTSIQVEAASCLSIFTKYLNAQEKLDTQIEKLEAKFKQVHKKWRTAMSNAGNAENNRTVKKFASQGGKIMAKQDAIVEKSNAIGDANDAKIKKCVDQKTSRGIFKGTWDARSFTSSYTDLLKAEDQAQRDFEQCKVDVKRARGNLDEYHMRCDPLHADWMDAERAKYQLIDDALR